MRWRRLLGPPLTILAAAACSQHQRKAEDGVQVVAARQPPVFARAQTKEAGPQPAPASTPAAAPDGARSFEDISRDIARITAANTKPIEKEKTIWID